MKLTEPWIPPVLWHPAVDGKCTNCGGLTEKGHMEIDCYVSPSGGFRSQRLRQQGKDQDGQ